MHDDTSLTVGRVKRVLDERIRPAIHSASRALTVEVHELEGEPIAPGVGIALDYAPYQVGTPWGPAWGTTWFKVTGAVPAEWADRRVEARIDIGFDVNMTGFQCEALATAPMARP